MYPYRNTLIGIIYIALFFFSYTAENKTIKIISSSLLIISLVISLILVQLNKDLPAKQKRLFWIVLLPLLSLIVNLISALS